MPPQRDRVRPVVALRRRGIARDFVAMDIATADAVDAAERALGVDEEHATKVTWLTRLVTRRMRRSLERARAKRQAGAYANAVPVVRAHTLIRWACAKAAVTGALSGVASTAAALVTAETEGLALVVALPSAIAAVAGEMAVRGIVHVDMACELAEVFEVTFDRDDADLMRLFTLVFGAHKHDEVSSEDLGKSLLEKITGPESGELVSHAGNLLVGESVLRNLVPVVSIFASAVTNVVVTYRLGHTLRRSFRYERAIRDALRGADQTCATVMDLLVEGMWLVFTADGHLSAEEVACLAQRLDDMSASERNTVLQRLTEEEDAFFERLRSIPEPQRDDFLRVLDVAAAVDKVVAVPETRLLERIAKTLGRKHDPSRIARLIASFEDTGLSGA